MNIEIISGQSPKLRVQISNEIIHTCFSLCICCCSTWFVIFKKPNTNTSLLKKKKKKKTAHASVSHYRLRSTGHLLLSLPCSSPCPVSYRLFEPSGECRKPDIIETEGRGVWSHSYRWRLWRTGSISAGEDGSGTLLSPLIFFFFFFCRSVLHPCCVRYWLLNLFFHWNYHPPRFGPRLSAFTDADWSVRSHVDGDRCPRSDPFSPSSSRLVHTGSRRRLRNVCQWRPVATAAGPPP